MLDNVPDRFIKAIQHELDKSPQCTEFVDFVESKAISTLILSDKNKTVFLVIDYLNSKVRSSIITRLDIDKINAYIKRV